MSLKPLVSKHYPPLNVNTGVEVAPATVAATVSMEATIPPPHTLATYDVHLRPTSHPPLWHCLPAAAAARVQQQHQHLLVT